MNTLTQPELDFIPCLRAVDQNSIWGMSIHAVVKDDEVKPYRFRLLVSELKSQNDDSPEIMLSILGKDCHSQLINL